MAELVDALSSGGSAFWRGGSTPLVRTKTRKGFGSFRALFCFIDTCIREEEPTFAILALVRKKFTPPVRCAFAKPELKIISLFLALRAPMLTACAEALAVAQASATALGRRRLAEGATCEARPLAEAPSRCLLSCAPRLAGASVNSGAFFCLEKIKEHL